MEGTQRKPIEGRTGLWGLCDYIPPGSVDYKGDLIGLSYGYPFATLDKVAEALWVTIGDREGGPLLVRFFPNRPYTDGDEGYMDRVEEQMEEKGLDPYEAWDDYVPEPVYGPDIEAVEAWMDPLDCFDDALQKELHLRQAIEYARGKAPQDCLLDGERMPFEAALRRIWEGQTDGAHVLVDALEPLSAKRV